MRIQLGKMWTAVVMCSLCLALIGCTTAQAQVVQSEQERVTSPDVPESDLSEAIAGNSAFAFDLYRALRAGDGGSARQNLFYSPYSISVALAMTYAGARGNTERQMADVLHFALSQERLHPALNALDLLLAGRGQGAEEDSFKLNLVNALWGQTGYKFLPDFLDLLAENYGAGLRLLDFARAPQESRTTINDWVSEETESKIEDLLPPDAINSDTVLVLTNAIYFNAKWKSPFDPGATGEGAFHLLDGNEVSVPMMRQMARFRYAEGDGVQAIELPYAGDELSMVVLLPAEGTFESFAGTLDAESAASILKRLQVQHMQLTMPKFTFESGFQLKDTLSAMGAPDAFTGAADFSGMDGSQTLFIGDVYHKAFVAVDEAGTEAAAATAVTMQKSMAAVQVTIDRPFVFLIRDIQTGALLFLGQVVDPSA